VSQDNSGRLVVSSSSDETIRLWDTSVRQCVGKYACLSTAWDVSFGPLGYYFAAACMDNTMSVYSTDRPTQVRLMTGHTSDVTCCSWHQNASLVISGSDDKTVRLWDLRVGQSVRLLRGSPAAISSVAVSPVGDKIAAGSDSGAIHMWDIGSGRQIGLLQVRAYVLILKRLKEAVPLSGWGNIGHWVFVMPSCTCSIMHLILSTLPYYIHTNKDVSISTHAGAHGAGALGGVLAEWRGPVYGRG